MSTSVHIPSLWPVTCHTDYVGKNSTFVAIQGHKYNGVDFIPLALQKGAQTIIADVTQDISPEIQQEIQKHEAELLFVDNPRRRLALLAAQKWQHPAQSLKIIAVTGTKGKTTTSWLLHHLLQEAGYSVALLSTVKNKIGTQEFSTQLTTQQPDYLHAFFHACVRQKITYVVMEVAAQAVSLHRVAGLSFDGIVFTNFAPTHGEFYATEHEYFAAKRALFSQVKLQAPFIINADDSKGQQLLADFAHAHSYALNSQALVKLSAIKSSLAGITGTVTHDDEQLVFNCPSLIGEFNGYNIAAALAMAAKLGVPYSAMAQSLVSFARVPGRLEHYSLANGAHCFIDYAHNPLSFKSVLTLLRSCTKHLIVVAGAGGDRDKLMRPHLGALMAEFADQVFITTDNPRSENPADICAAIYAGISPELQSKATIELDRHKAIVKACAYAQPGTIVALLGKGPDEYQIIGDRKHPFSERQIVQSL